MLNTGLIRKKRQEKGLSQQNLADLLNITQNTLHRVESGVSSPRWDLVLQIAIILEVNPLDFIPNGMQHKLHHLSKLPDEKNFDIIVSSLQEVISTQKKLLELQDEQIKQLRN